MADEENGSYPRVLWRHWKAAVMAWLGTAGLVFGTTLVSTLDWPAWVWLFVALSGVFFAQYRAWRDAHFRVLTLSHEIRQRFDSVKYGLLFDRAVITVRLRREDQEPGVHVGISLKNGATEPLVFDVESMNVTLDSYTLTEPTFDTSGAILAPDQGYFYWFPWFDGLEVRRGMKGTIDYVVLYGHPEQGPRFRLEHRQEIECVQTLEDGDWRIEVRDLLRPTVSEVVSA
ncbi:MAG: hypothetical protein LC808_01030 [Actinobacteria bacterium]|nr:hypothetical protein [Actinomycetota bacterium]